RLGATDVDEQRRLTELAILLGHNIGSLEEFRVRVVHRVRQLGSVNRAEHAVTRRPHANPRLAALGVVQPLALEQDTAPGALRYMRSEAGGLLPAADSIPLGGALRSLAGTVARRRNSSGLEPVIVAAGLGFEATFLTVVDELQHVRDPAPRLLRGRTGATRPRGGRPGPARPRPVVNRGWCTPACRGLTLRVRASRSPRLNA